MKSLVFRPKGASGRCFLALRRPHFGAWSEAWSGPGSGPARQVLGGVLGPVLAGPGVGSGGSWEGSRGRFWRVLAGPRSGSGPQIFGKNPEFPEKTRKNPKKPQKSGLDPPFFAKFHKGRASAPFSAGLGGYLTPLYGVNGDFTRKTLFERGPRKVCLRAYGLPKKKLIHTPVIR